MPNHAQITIIGHAGKDPETRYTAGGDAVCSVSVATSRKRKGEETTSWWRVQAFGKTAEALANYITKGQAFGVVGEPVIEEWTDKDGNKRTTPTIYADRIILLGAPTAEQQQNRKAAHAISEDGGLKAGTKQGGHFDDMKDDIPF